MWRWRWIVSKGGHPNDCNFLDEDYMHIYILYVWHEDTVYTCISMYIHISVRDLTWEKMINPWIFLSHRLQATVRTAPAQMMAGVPCWSLLSAEMRSQWRRCCRMVRRWIVKNLKADGSWVAYYENLWEILIFILYLYYWDILRHKRRATCCNAFSTRSTLNL